MKKILSLTLVAVMLFSMIPTAFATNTYNNPDANTEMGTDVAVTGERTTVNDDGTVSYNAEYTITVPAKLIPGVNQTASGTVTLEGYWPSDATVTVTAQDKVKVVNNINNGDEKELAITFAPIVKAGDNDGIVTASETVTVAGIDAALFGSWEGVFNYNVEYADGTTSGDSGSTAEPSEGQISFTIDGVTYLAEEGMNWEQWVASDYNTEGFIINASGYLAKSDGTKIANEMKWTQIFDGNTYVTAA